MTALVLPLTMIPFQSAIWFHTSLTPSSYQPMIVYAITIVFIGMLFPNLADLVDSITCFITTASYFLLGTYLTRVVGIEEILPFHTLCNRVGTSNKWGINIQHPSSLHFIWTMGLFAFIIIYPIMIFSMKNHESVLVATALVIMVKVLYIFLVGLFFGKPDPFVFGPHESNMDELGTKYDHRGTDRAAINERNKDSTDTTIRIVRACIFIIFCDIIPTTMLCVTRYFQDDPEWNWVFALVMGIVLSILTMIGYVYQSYLV